MLILLHLCNNIFACIGTVNYKKEKKMYFNPIIKTIVPVEYVGVKNKTDKWKKITSYVRTLFVIIF